MQKKCAHALLIGLVGVMFACTVLVPAPCLTVKLDAERWDRTGKAKATVVAGIFWFGDASLTAAMKNGSIARVHHVDYQKTTFLGIIQTTTTIVNGEKATASAGVAQEGMNVDNPVIAQPPTAPTQAEYPVAVWRQGEERRTAVAAITKRGIIVRRFGSVVQEFSIEGGAVVACQQNSISLSDNGGTLFLVPTDTAIADFCAAVTAALSTGR